MSLTFASLFDKIHAHRIEENIRSMMHWGHPGPVCAVFSYGHMRTAQIAVRIRCIVHCVIRILVVQSVQKRYMDEAGFGFGIHRIVLVSTGCLLFVFFVRVRSDARSVRLCCNAMCHAL
jgi:hypothetical protein